MKHLILSHLPEAFPWQVHWFDTITSTNDKAKAMARQGAPHGTVLIAGHQSNGRGRMGRDFYSPAGKGIYLSAILRPNCSASALMHLTCAVGVAVCDAVETVTGFRPDIKWINDLIANRKKLGGILTELCLDSANETVRYAVVGIGLNCSQARTAFPLPVQNIAISLEEATGQPIAQAVLAAAIIHALYKMNATLLTGKDICMAAYRNNCITLGQEVTVLNGKDEIHGIALDVDDNGALLVKFPDQTIHAINSGEVSLRGGCGYV